MAKMSAQSMKYGEMAKMMKINGSKSSWAPICRASANGLKA
jgi:hypothetical protein